MTVKEIIREHSCNVLVHQDLIIKLADFGLSKRIEAASKSKSKLLGMIPYIDPKSVMDDNNSIKLKEKFNVYSVGVLLWEISSGIPPFYEETYDLSLMFKISQECWNSEPNSRPSMHEVVKTLKMLIQQNGTK
ncbi:kinase-like domain-containing protein [Glomus cerebriforme]|uniref:Kinase-like domain-containing protein n=1 Tax=Glomus cerebriforme TaxID=658196 RepID=A0A397SED2_9GLOM|nr:kinase-like domain-containing protein [Glomus cerebriforme]